MVMCWAPGCNHYNIREKCRFYKFPTDNNLRNKWIQLIRPGDSKPGLHARLCSCHFPDGKRENIPTIFGHNEQKLFTFSSSKIKIEPGITAEAIGTPSDTPKKTESVWLQRPADHSKPSTSGIYKGPKTSTSVAVLEAENYFLQQRITELEKESRGGAFTFKHIEENDSLCRLYTGLPSKQHFLALYSLLENIPIKYYYRWKVEKISKMDQLLMCLMKLRQNYPHTDLAVRFNISQATVTNIVITWVHLLHDILFKQLMGSTSCLRNCLTYFKIIVLDSTEMSVTVSRKTKLCQKSTSTSSKHNNTWKAVIGVTPSGVITYVSTLYPGAMSDKNIVQHCGIMENLKAGDLILSDKGLLLNDLLQPAVNLNVSHFIDMDNLETGNFVLADKDFLLNDLLSPEINLNVPTSGKLTPSQIKQYESNARASFEKPIQKIRQYKIINFMARALFEHAGMIVQLIGSLSNLNNIKLRRDSAASDSE